MRAALLGLSFGLFSASTAAAQEHAIVGVVEDSVGRPVAGAEVRIGSTVQRSDDQGRFRFLIPRQDSVSIDVLRLGYAPVHFRIVFPGRDDEITITLDALAQAIDTVQVRERDLRALTMLRGFDERRALGLGSYITRDFIERRNTTNVVELIRDQPGITVRRGGAILFARHDARSCAPDIYLDGQHAPGLNPQSINAMDLEGIELYRGQSQVPAEFIRPGRVFCGALVLWTRRPITMRRASTPQPGTP
ncbi:MAG TPA: carboxypeptidase regulatory-like domain-containing protein [Gemmatimonadaceae bacterium]|nr:carboxypeptidase regulatory-like domain-containing protein [Gemmatimonadaceae bacterium]